VPALVSAAWDLAAIEREYERFITEFTSRDRPDAVTRLVELVHAWRRFPAIDPALPRELLPGRWTGLRAASLFADRYERWGGEARIEWKRLNDIG
jgi:phenylacetic acid degradation operon negative regulatory protein